MKEQINGMSFGLVRQTDGGQVQPEQHESKMIMSNLFLILGILSAFWGVASFLVIASFLSKRGIKINFLLFRILMFKYIRQYRTITMQESGRPGPWYYSFVVSMNLALLLTAVGIVLRAI